MRTIGALRLSHARSRLFFIVDLWGEASMMCQSSPATAALIGFVVCSVSACSITAMARPGANVDSLGQQVEQLDVAGKYAEAAEVAKRELALAESQFGPNHPKVANALADLGGVYVHQGRYAEAEPLYKRALAIDEKALGPGHADIGRDLNNLAALYHVQGRHAEAEPLYKRALAIDEKALGGDHHDVGTDLGNLASLYHDQGRYAEAEPLYKRALAIDEKALGGDHHDIGTDLGNLAELYREQGRYAEAEPLYKRALAIDEKALGGDHHNVGIDLGNLANLYRAQGRYAEADSLYKRALAIDEKALRVDHPDLAADLSNLASLYQTQGRYTEAEPLYKRALAIDEKVLRPDHPDIGSRLYSLAGLYRAQGRFAEAEALYKRALAIKEKTHGPDHPEIGTALFSIAALYRDQGRYAEAEPLYKRALAIDEKALGGDHPTVGTTLVSLAGLYRDEGRYAEAEPLYNRALAIYAKALGLDHPNVGTVLNNLALLLRFQRRYAEAEPLYKRALAILEKALGPDHPFVATTFISLARLYSDEGRYGEAEPLFKRALKIDEKALNPDHPLVSAALANLASLYFQQGDWVRATEQFRSSTSIIVDRAQQGKAIGEALTGERKSEAAQLSWRFKNLVKAAHRLVSQKGNDADLARDMFQTAQWAQSSDAAESLAQMAARGAKGEAKLAALTRERQDLVAEWQKRDELRSGEIAQEPEQRNRNAEAENVARLGAIEARIAIIDKELAVEFPDYAALASPAPLPTEAVQAQLRADEALVLFLDTPEWKPTPEETFIWVVTKTDARWVRSELGTPALTREVGALRCGLDYDSVSFLPGQRCAELLKVSYTMWDRANDKPIPFDVARSHALYKALFGQIEDLIRDKKLLIVPSGALTQLPFQVLVTQPPKIAFPNSNAEYRDVPWLARKHAVTILPAVSSLKALRDLAKASHASEKYIGFGNPLLDGDLDGVLDEKTRAKRIAAAKLARDKRCAVEQAVQTAELTDSQGGTGSISRGPEGLVDLASLRKWPPLPETADELCGVANILGVDASTQVHIGADAREQEIKRLSYDGELAKYEIIHFATHGALAGQLSLQAEPGLLLTPPEKPSDIDDGFLTASEIAGLKLDADWVILSACNTAAAGVDGAEALSGLARAFFYAGSRSLMVSHWQVASHSAVPLITTAIATLSIDPRLGRAEALRRAMVDRIDQGKSYEAHPSIWAPFVLVGEGAASR
jgi:tetratricopeptide (TPR) repeat protein/CHAT domain-containing protein